MKGKSILLIDDTFTTGTTLLECARTLHQSGGRNIYGMTFAAGIR
ncbi:MAG: ComF family protein [Peptococcales bacterium]